MKRAKNKDLWREIGSSLNRFLSILFIVALGVAFFSGIRSSRSDMELSGDRYFDETYLMDIHIAGTLGLTDEDVEAVRQIDEILEAVGAYTAEVFADSQEQALNIKVFSVTDGINLFTLKEGRMPERAGECLIDANLLINSQLEQTGQFALGDTLRVRSGTDDPLEDTLGYEEFVIVGIGSSSRFLSIERGTCGIGNGSLDGFIAVTPDNFTLEVYTDMYALSRQGKDMTAYSRQYEDYITEITDQIEAELSDMRCQVRFDDVVGEANEKLDDARQELADEEANANQKLSDASAEIADAEVKIEEGYADVADGEETLKKGREDLAQAEIDLADGKKTLAEKEQELLDGKRTLAEKEQELADAKVTLTEKEQELLDAKVTLSEREPELEDARVKLQDARTELEDGRRTYNEEYEDARKELDRGWDEYYEGKEIYDDSKDYLEEQEQVLADARKQYQQALGPVQDGVKQVMRALLKMGVPIGMSGNDIDNIRVQTFDIDTYGEYLSMVQTEQVNGEELAAAVYMLQETDQQITEGTQEIKEGKKELTEAKYEMTAAKRMLDSAERKLQKAEQELKDGEQKIIDAEQELADGEQKLADAKQEVADGEQKLNDAKQEVADGEVKLADARHELTDGEVKLEDARQELADGEKKIADAKVDIAKGEQDIEDARVKLADGDAELADAKIKYEDAKAEADEKITDAHKEIDDAQEEVHDIKMPEWYVMDRNSMQTYAEFGNDAERIGAIGEVFPFIFFMVAALVSLTTMTRMVEEQRLHIGTFHALGYGRRTIASKYISYAFLATLGGSLLGVLVGEKLLPYVIMNAYFILYDNIPYILTPYNLEFGAMASGLALACTILAAFQAVYRELKLNPAQLMRPAAPRQGKRVLLERAVWIWSRLSFIQKSTVRNLFRYKRRCLMTVFGIGGCMALLLVGFGLYDSIYTLGERQYNDVWVYDVMLQMDDDVKLEEKVLLDEVLDGRPVQERMKVSQSIIDVTSNGATKEVYQFVPEDMEKREQFVHLRDRRTQEEIPLTDEHVVITEKLAKLLEVGVGDTIELMDGEDVRYPVEVGGIAENYLHHYVYMSPILYDTIYNGEPEYNTMFLKLDQEAITWNRAEEDALGGALLSCDYVTSVTFVREMRSQIWDMLDSLNVVIYVLIVSAGLLAFVVLYNLNNINITERQRELATIKVLGFYDMELAAYVYRENVILTVLGVAAGVLMGFLLHRYVMTTVEVDMLMFGRTIQPLSYLYSAVLTGVFSAFVNFIMYFRLKKINMVESLKSVE